MAEYQNYIESKSARQQEKPAHTLSEDRGQFPDDAQYLGWLSMRVRNADWSLYERGADAFIEIEKDLKQLHIESPVQAAELWANNAPKGLQLPEYITDRLQALDRPDERIITLQSKDASAQDEKYAVPESIRKRYLEAEGKFYYREASNKLAFEDRGVRLHTEHNDPAIASSMVEIAAAKGWSGIKANGSDEFKREIWLQASLKNIEVTGFKPKEVDLAKLDEMRSVRMKNSIESEAGREPAPALKSMTTSLKTFIDKATLGAQIPDQFRGNVSAIGEDLQGLVERRAKQQTGLGPDPEKNPQQFSGKLLDHGEAHLDFDKKNEKSYFVKLETVNGSRIHWGEHLKEIVMQSPAAGKAGERIDLLAKEPQVQLGKSKQASDARLEGGYKVAVAVMTDVLREKGYSPKVLDKAVSEATRRLDQLKSGGEHAPIIKVFDKSAPRETVRERLKPSKSKQREAERNR